jgi:heme O synthase-like polyprenyltransferase
VPINVSELDHAKEQLAYFKLWQGVMIVTEISVVGWLISSWNSAAPSTVLLALAGVLLLTIGVGVLHRQIGRRIDEIRKL